MPRPATRKANAAAADRASSKRRRTPDAVVKPQAKRPKRQSRGAASTPTKSQYFKKRAASEDGEDEAETVTSEDDDEKGDNGSDFELKDESSAEPEEEEDDDDEYNSEEEAPKPRKRGRPKTNSSTKSRSAHQEDNEDDETFLKPGSKLAPGTRLVIQKPKPRSAGSTPYTDETIHPNTMLFLGDLGKNNERQWLKSHDPDYRESQNDFNSFVECLTSKLIEADDTIPELPIKDIIFRIYRDIRFSKDPTPYKPYFSAAWSRTGRKGPYAAYYVQIQPGNKSFVGGGLWQPEPSSLAALRNDIDRKPHKIKRVLAEERLRKDLLGVARNDEAAAVKAFAKQNAESALKTKPKGYENDHENIELLRLRNFTIGKKVEDKDVVGPEGLENISRLMTALVPFVTYLNGVVRPDDPDGSSSDGESGQSDAEDDGDED